MPNDQLPPKLTLAQTRIIVDAISKICDDAVNAFGAHPDVVREELAFACARYAVNAGVLDRERVVGDVGDPVLPQEGCAEKPTDPVASGAYYARISRGI